ncbi:hypothetical protein ID866_5744 [Astraeus odoratus]|nr:hypothetical protein ID866_5744 [Astraeus odoratus]
MLFLCINKHWSFALLVIQIGHHPYSTLQIAFNPGMSHREHWETWRMLFPCINKHWSFTLLVIQRGHYPYTTLQIA